MCLSCYLQHLSHLRDGDMSSIHSGDGSNTDSGRGTSETGESGPGTKLEAHQAGRCTQANPNVSLYVYPAHETHSLVAHHFHIIPRPLNSCHSVGMETDEMVIPSEGLCVLDDFTTQMIRDGTTQRHRPFGFPVPRVAQ